MHACFRNTRSSLNESLSSAYPDPFIVKFDFQKREMFYHEHIYKHLKHFESEFNYANYEASFYPKEYAKSFKTIESFVKWDEGQQDKKSKNELWQACKMITYDKNVIYCIQQVNVEYLNGKKYLRIKHFIIADETNRLHPLVVKKGQDHDESSYWDFLHYISALQFTKNEKILLNSLRSELNYYVPVNEIIKSISRKNDVRPPSMNKAYRTLRKKMRESIAGIVGIRRITIEMVYEFYKKLGYINE